MLFDRAGPAVRLGDRVDDGQAEPDPARRTGAGRIGAGKAIKDPAQRLIRDAAALILDLDHHPAHAVGAGSQLDSRRGQRVLDGVLEQGIERRAQPLGVRDQLTGNELPQPPAPRRDLSPAHEYVLEQRIELDGSGLDEARVVGVGQQQQASQDRIDAAELVEGDVYLRNCREPCERSSSRWPRAIVIGVRSSCEASWTKRSWRSSRERRSSARCSATSQRLDATPRVPHHGQEHRRHQRHLEQLAPELDPRKASRPIETPVIAITAASTIRVGSHRPDPEAVERA